MKNNLPFLILAFALVLPFLFFKGKTIEKIPASGNTVYKESEHAAYDALTFLSAMYAYPNSDIPPDGYAKAWLRHQEISAASMQGSTRNSWQNLGPNNIGGRTVSIAIDPIDTAVIWLGSASGGLWKSITGGIGTNAWTYVPTGFPVLGVGAIAINSSNHDEMFIGTGETYAYGASTNGLVDRTQRGSFGIGILKTTDGGATWSMSLDWTYQQNRGVWEILYDPDNGSTLYAATTEGVYKTIDGGVTWNNVLDRKMVMDMVIDSSDPNILFAGVGNEQSADKGIYKTTDGGATWILLTGNGLPSSYTNDGRITISSCAGDNNVLMAIIGNMFDTQGVYRSNDKGLTWSLVNGTAEIVTYQGWYAKGLLIKDDNSSQLLAGGVEVFKSINSGTVISPSGYVHADIHDIISNPFDPDKVYVITDGGLFRSSDFGDSYFECTDGYVTSQHYIGSVSASDANIALSGLQDNSTLRYDGTPYWVPVIGGDGCYNAIRPDNDYVQYGCYQYLNIYESVDQGFSFFGIYFTPSNPNGGNPAAFLAPLVMSISNPNVLYAGGTTLIKSTNGASFNAVQPDPIDSGNVLLSIGISAQDDDTVYFATAPDAGPMHVYRSYDGGVTKTDISAGLPNRYPRRITVNPQNSQEVYIVFSGFGGGHIFKSENGGASWADISTSLPDMPFHCLAIDPLQPQNIYAGCDFTAYASTDGGLSWFAFDDALPEAVMVFDLVVSTSDHTLYAFTHGHGVYKTDLLNIGISTEDLNTATAQLTCYPNPSSNNIHISWNNKLQDILSISLYDLNGKKVLEKTMQAADHSSDIDVSKLPAGSYLLQLEGQEFHQAKKVAVVR